MSHFRVLVIGDDIEDQLAPYNENIEVEPYKSYIDIANLQELARSVRVRVPDEGRPDPDDITAVVGYYEEGATQDEQGWYTWSTDNPKSKWDYWRIGGRWGGVFLLKPGRTGVTSEIAWELTFNNPTNTIAANRCDQARKGDIDFHGMDGVARAQAEEHWQRMDATVAGLPLALNWKQVREQIPDIEEARRFYGDQVMVQALQAARLDGHDDPIGRLALGQEEYVERLVQGAWAPYAMVNQGEWQAPGRMGWFGMSSEDPDELAAWHAEVRSVVLNLADGYLLTMVDCHI